MLLPRLGRFSYLLILNYYYWLLSTLFKESRLNRVVESRRADTLLAREAWFWDYRILEVDCSVTFCFNVLGFLDELLLCCIY